MHQAGRGVREVVGAVVADVISSLRADKNMRWGDPGLAYSRPIRWVVALWGDTVVPVQVSELGSGRTTYVDRRAAGPLVEVENASVLVPKLEERGIILDPAVRRESVVAQAQELALQAGGSVDVEAEADLVDEITNLVEAPHGILGSFEERYLELPEQILTTVMRKHQRYLPVRSGQGRLMPYFVTMANGDCDDDLVRTGNENVLRARYEDAAFFYDADLKVPLEDLRAGIAKLTFEDRVGSMSDRADRIRDVAAALAGLVGLETSEEATLARAGQLAKFDLASQMVVELSSLAGFMAREYALKAGETPEVATALYEMELPRSAGDAPPTTRPGALLALADRFDLLMAMFALGAKPTGSSDPFALRRAALGVIAILRSQPTLAGLTVTQGLEAAAVRLRQQGLEVSDESLETATEFVTGRFAQQLREEGVPTALASAVQPLADAPGKAEAALHDIESVRGRDGFPRLVEATQRITRLVPQGSSAAYDPQVLREDAERALHEKVATLPDLSASALPEWADAAGAIVPQLERFFDEVLVMADEPGLRAARLGLLQTIVDRAPRGIDWRALHSALSD
jgi:glycyl-tRNA synthetase